MQEHGLIGRVIMMYRQCIRNIEAGIEFDPALLVDAASMLAHVIHGHHELEEGQILFPIVERRPCANSRRCTSLMDPTKTRSVYPAFGDALMPPEYIKYSKVFAVEERKVNGVDGFERRSTEPRKIEDALGLSLARYTEQVAPLRKTEEGVRCP